MTATVEFVTAPASRPARRPAAPVGRAASPSRRPAARGRIRVASVAPVASSCVVPQPIAASSAVQLTRRGWTVLLSVATAVAAVLVYLAFLSHPAAAGPSVAAPTQVVVQSGDTLWSIAARVAPGRDPRAVVYDLQQANHLGDATVVEGQVLRTR